MPGIIIDGEAAAPTLTVVDPSAPPPAPSLNPSASPATAQGSQDSMHGGKAAHVTFRAGSGAVAFMPPPSTSAHSSLGGLGAGKAAHVTFCAGGGAVSFMPPPSAPSPSPSPATPSPPELPPEIRLTTAQLVDVSRALMGRLDIADLVGRSTTLEIAERVGGTYIVMRGCMARWIAERKWHKEENVQ